MYVVTVRIFLLFKASQINGIKQNHGRILFLREKLHSNCHERCGTNVASISKTNIYTLYLRTVKQNGILRTISTYDTNLKFVLPPTR